MAYEPTVWQDGDIVTSQKLNKIEQGIAIGGGIQIIETEINDEGEVTQINISFNELVNLIENGVIPIFLMPMSFGNGYIQSLYLFSGYGYVPISPQLPNEMIYTCTFLYGDVQLQFSSDSPDTYMTDYISALGPSSDDDDDSGSDNSGGQK